MNAESLASSLAWFNRQWLPLYSQNWSLSDFGPMYGAIAVERLRTFGGVPFQVEAHIERFLKTCQFLNIDLRAFFDRSDHRGSSDAILDRMVKELVQRNRSHLNCHGDVGLVILASPGDPSFDPLPSASEELLPTVGMHLIGLPWARLARWYQQGCELHVSKVQNVSADCWPPQIKTRSRLHYYLADLEAHRHQPGSIAILLNEEQHVTETSVANLVAIQSNVLICPKLADILSGISLQFLFAMAESLELEVRFEHLTAESLINSNEILLTGTTGCIWPAVRVNGQNIGDGQPGPIGMRIRNRWEEQIGFPFVQQAIDRSSAKGPT